MSIIDRYIYAVVSELPEKGKEEISKEIKGLIYDMMESYSEDISDSEKADKALRELGKPEVFADNYRDKKRYLIGPKLFNKYLYVLKIVLGALCVAISIVYFIKLIGGPFGNASSISGLISEYISSLLSALLQGAAWTTVGFAILEYNGTDLSKKEEKLWNPSSLPKIPDHKATIKPSESILSIIFTTVFFMLFYFTPENLAIWIFKDGNNLSIPLLNLEKLDNIKLLIIGIFIIGICKEISKIFFGRWSIKLAITYSALNILSAALLIILILNPSFINPQFADFTSSNLKLLGDNMPFSKILNVTTLIIVGITVIEVAVSAYKGIKYDKF